MMRSVMVIAGLAASEPDASGAMTSDELRREPITFRLDVPYAADSDSRHRLDIYLPSKARSDKLPVIVFLHDSGDVQGDKADGARRLLPFVRTGTYAGISVGYRPSDQARWPARLHDCKAAIRWIRANAARYHLDPGNIGVWGLGTGGHLALMLGLTGDVSAFNGKLGRHGRVSSEVQAVANFYGVPDASAQPLPATHANRGDPPVLIVHGTADRTVPYEHASGLDTALKAAGVSSQLVTVYRSGHGDFGTIADRRVEAFFDKYLRASPYGIPTNGLAKTPDPELLAAMQQVCLRGNCRGPDGRDSSVDVMRDQKGQAALLIYKGTGCSHWQISYHDVWGNRLVSQQTGPREPDEWNSPDDQKIERLRAGLVEAEGHACRRLTAAPNTKP
jgi:acetyl esterase/lipase